MLLRLSASAKKEKLSLFLAINFKLYSFRLSCKSPAENAQNLPDSIHDEGQNDDIDHANLFDNPIRIIQERD